MFWHARVRVSECADQPKPTPAAPYLPEVLSIEAQTYLRRLKPWEALSFSIEGGDPKESDLDVSGHNLTAAIAPPSATVPPQQTLEDLEAKRKKRLELNRKAAQESRRRKKMKVEELQRNVAALTRENGVGPPEVVGHLPRAGQSFALVFRRHLVARARECRQVGHDAREGGQFPRQLA